MEDTIKKIQALANDFFSEESLKKLLRDIDIPKLKEHLNRPENSFLTAKILFCAIAKSGRLQYEYAPPRTNSYPARIRLINKLSKKI